MPNTRFTAQMYDHIIDPVRGPQVGHRLEYYAPAAIGESWNRGAVISADNTGKLVAGCLAGSSFNRPMPMFALQGTDDLDVWSDDVNPQRDGAGAPAGVPSALVASGGFEIATSEFESEDSGDAVIYNVNDQLTCDETGKLIKKTSASEPTVGIVSAARTANGVRKNELGVQVRRYTTDLLFLWTFFIPAE